MPVVPQFDFFLHSEDQLMERHTCPTRRSFCPFFAIAVIAFFIYFDRSIFIEELNFSILWQKLKLS